MIDHMEIRGADEPSIGLHPLDVETLIHSVSQYLSYQNYRLRCLFVLVFAREHQTLDHKEQTYHSSNRDICPPCLVKSQRGDDILDRAQGQNTKERADDIADAAGQHCAADDGGPGR